MPEEYYGLVEVTLFYTAAFGFCLWQLVQLRRDSSRDQDKPNSSDTDLS